MRKPSRNQSIHHDEQRTMRLRPWLRLPPLQKQRSTHILHATSSNDETSNIESQKQQDEEQRQQFTIRNCKFADLKAVSDIIVNSFYTDSMRSSPFAAVLKLGELNRLQQNFPYNDSERHVMLVATANTNNGSKTSSSDGSGQIVGFVDLDARPATRRMDPPRPYLSDLAVHPEHRRCGIATILIQTCEALVYRGSVRMSVAPAPSEDSRSSTVTENARSDKELFIRVERANVSAIQMYEKFDYQAISHSIFGVEDTTVLMRKQFHHDS